MGHVKQDSMPVIRELSAFDRHSGNLLERLVFNHRALFMLVMTLATLVLGYMGATRLALAPSAGTVAAVRPAGPQGPAADGCWEEAPRGAGVPRRVRLPKQLGGLCTAGDAEERQIAAAAALLLRAVLLQPGPGEPWREAARGRRAASPPLARALRV